MTTPTPKAPTPGAVLDAAIKLAADLSSIGEGRMSKKINDLIDLYRLASPAASPPVAVDGSAKGLEVVGWTVATSCGSSSVYLPGKEPVKPDWLSAGYVTRPLTDHAEASRQIAERDARIEQLKRLVRTFQTAIPEPYSCTGSGLRSYLCDLKDRIKAAEADAAKVRESIIDRLTQTGSVRAQRDNALSVARQALVTHTKRVA